MLSQSFYRPVYAEAVNIALARSPVVALVGPRQVGKTTLARAFCPPNSAQYFDLEDPVSVARLAEPMAALAPLTGLVVIDEVQYAPELFKVLRVLADRPGVPARFLILGSASPALLRQSAESLAGRIELIEMAGFALSEVADSALSSADMEKRWWRGGYPRAYLARSDADSRAWRRNLIQTFVERDLPQLGINVPAVTMRRFWAMLAHWHGQLWNAAEPARSFGVNETTIRRYLDILTGAFVVRQLPPWHENLNKRQVKAPKVYVRDCGLAHELLGINTPKQLLEHPKCGATWEGWLLEETLFHARAEEAYFWATHNGAELDLLLFKNGQRIGVEFKRADAPKLTPSMRHALDDLKLDRLIVFYPGALPYRLHARVEVIPALALTEVVWTA